MDYTVNRRKLTLAAGALAGGAAMGRISGALAQDATPQASPAAGGEVYKQSPWWPWLTAHINDEEPPDVIGGPVTTTIMQDEGGAAFWALPAKRELDPTVFGTPDDPKATVNPPIFYGVPVDMREQTDDGTWQTSVPTPFGDKFAAVTGSVSSKAVDATAIDGATTKDEIDFEATFQAPKDQGSYRVVVKKPAPHGWLYPTGGGVVTDVILHGVTGWGTHLMPTEFTYSAFWGAGDIYHNDEMIAEGHAVHMMLTEFVRKDPYDLVWDKNVNPNNRHMHLIVPPFTLKGEQDPVPTGFMLPNGMEQPFFHVMFPQLTVDRTMG